MTKKLIDYLEQRNWSGFTRRLTAHNFFRSSGYACDFDQNGSAYDVFYRALKLGETWAKPVWDALMKRSKESSLSKTEMCLIFKTAIVNQDVELTQRLVQWGAVGVYLNFKKHPEKNLFNMVFPEDKKYKPEILFALLSAGKLWHDAAIAGEIIKNDDLETLKRLPEHGIDLRRVDMALAVGANKHVANFILDQKPEIQTISIRTGSNLYGYVKELSIAERLHKMGLDVNFGAERRGVSQLRYVQTPAIFKFMVLKGVATTETGKNIKTTLWHNILEKGSAFLQVALECGFNPNAVIDAKKRTTPLMCCEQVESARALLDADADVKARDVNGETALHHQITRPEIVEALLTAGLSPNIKNFEGKTAIEKARETFKKDPTISLGQSILLLEPYEPAAPCLLGRHKSCPFMQSHEGKQNTGD